MRPVALLLLPIIISSCYGDRTEREPDNVIQKSANPAEKLKSVSCYEWTGNNDTIKLRIEINGTDVTGTITYDYSQKDRNEGALKGKLQGDIIIADYSFDSEGSRSVRQVAYKRTGDDIVEGFGSMEDIDGKMTFIHPDSLIFNPSFIIPAKDCQ